MMNNMFQQQQMMMQVPMMQPTMQQPMQQPMQHMHPMMMQQHNTKGCCKNPCLAPQHSSRWFNNPYSSLQCP
jgi:hypothetical protein